MINRNLGKSKTSTKVRKRKSKNRHRNYTIAITLTCVIIFAGWLSWGLFTFFNQGIKKFELNTSKGRTDEELQFNLEFEGDPSIIMIVALGISMPTSTTGVATKR